MDHKPEFRIDLSPSPVPAVQRAQLLENPGFGRIFTDHMVTATWEAGKGWHEHFTPVHMERLLRKAGFEVVLFDGSGLFTRVLDLVMFFGGRFPPLARLISAVQRADAKRFKSMNLFCIARRLPQGSADGEGRGS